MDIKVRAKIIKPLEENLWVNLHDLGLGGDFLDRMPKAQVTKEKLDKLDFNKIKIFCATNDTSKKGESNPQNREKY